MEVDIGGGLALKNFTKSLTCLSRFGDEIDFLVKPSRLSISTVNTSRTAFGVVQFYPKFFQHYDPRAGTGYDEDDSSFAFSVNAKSLLSPLRPRSANTIESCTISVFDGSEDHPELNLQGRERRRGGGIETGECRIVIKLHCQHGVVKTHRLTYGNPNVNNWARFDKNHCTAGWRASSKILKEWMDHFHLRSGANASMDEVTFYCHPLTCRLKSFNDTSMSEQNMTENEIISSRPLTTELMVDVEDFDDWDCSNQETITFALKEFKSVITFSESLSLPISAHYTTGGKPLMFVVEGDHLNSRFIVATTDYDSTSGGGSTTNNSGRRSNTSETPSEIGGGGGVKREKSESLALREQQRGVNGSGVNGSNGGGGRPLFNQPTPSPAPQQQSRQSRRQVEEEEDEFDYGGMGMEGGDLFFEDPDAAFEEIERLSQRALLSASQQQQQASSNTTNNVGVGGKKILVPDTSTAGPSTGGGTGRREESTDSLEYVDGDHHERERLGSSVEPEARRNDDGTNTGGEKFLGPTQKNDGTRQVKRAKWNILGDGF